MRNRRVRLGCPIAADVALACALVTAFYAGMFIAAFMLMGAISETALAAQKNDDSEHY